MYATTYVAMEEMRLKLSADCHVRMIMIFSRSVNCQQDFGLRRNRSICVLYNMQRDARKRYLTASGPRYLALLPLSIPGPPLFPVTCKTNQLVHTYYRTISANLADI